MWYRTFPNTIGKSRTSTRGGGVPTRPSRRIISRVIWLQSASEYLLIAMRSAKICLVVVSYLAETRLFHSTSWFYARKMTGMNLSGAALAAALTLIVCTSVVSAAPFSGSEECELNAEIGTLCEQCAKTTKSPIVYPMCCQNTEEARDWCVRYLHFGSSVVP